MAEESEKRFHAIMDKLIRPSTSGTAKCKPWDREEFFNRIATFKAMTWSAKPQVVSTINCARRGWVNVYKDTIRCESCAAEHKFCTPPSWAQKQVESEALKFSLKLNDGHKLLCPWVDNACDEKLAQFPPTSPLDLVDKYKKRCASLLQLFKLPVVSSAIDIIRTPLLEHFLNCPPTLDESEEVLHVLYYQAQKLISLCGWELRLLPYNVDCKDVQKDAEGLSTESEEYHHTSVALGCKLCGASVGLWAFSTTPRPAKFGGPPPAKQNFRPTISLPVVGQNLRTRFSSTFQSVESSTSNGPIADDNKPHAAPAEQSKAMEFDPIMQHRHFCPWITSSGKAAPGWKQTLAALERQKEFVYPSETTQASSSLIEVEDPVGSVRKLLTPPSAKTKKFTHGSS